MKYVVMVFKNLRNDLGGNVVVLGDLDKIYLISLAIQMQQGVIHVH